MVEIGPGNGSFLRLVAERLPDLKLAYVEPNPMTRKDRDGIADVEQFSRIDELLQGNQRFHVVCLFHVLEHIIEPAPFLQHIREIVEDSGLVLIEVPSLDDPLLGLDAVRVHRPGTDAELRPIPKTRPDDFIGQLTHIRDALDAGSADESPIRLSRGAATIRVVEAAHRSATERRSVTLGKA